mgnify:CR=1 FL=1
MLVFPTHVGVNLDWDVAFERIGGFPHARGGEPREEFGRSIASPVGYVVRGAPPLSPTRLC